MSRIPDLDNFLPWVGANHLKRYYANKRGIVIDSCRQPFFRFKPSFHVKKGPNEKATILLTA
jgi:hypothetical protein